MGICISSLSPSAPHYSSSLSTPPHCSVSASNDSNNVGFSATTNSAEKSQFLETASGSFDGEGSLPLPSLNGQILKRPNLKVFTFEDLKSATNNFRHSLNQGGFGRVYKGWLDEKSLTPTRACSRMAVAIKRINPRSNNGFRQWQNYNVKITDFSFDKLVPTMGKSHVTSIQGPNGYIVPEYFAKGKLYVKDDLFKFGTMLLQMLTGKRRLFTDPTKPREEQSLLDLVINHPLTIKNKLKSIMDAKIEGQYSQEAAFQAIQLSLKCRGPDLKQHPSMKDVLEALEAIEDIQVKSDESKNLNSH